MTIKLVQRDILIALAFFAAGVLLTTYVLLINPLSRSSAAFAYFSTVGQLDSYVYMQCQLGTPATCESALTHYIEKLNTVGNGESAQKPEAGSRVIFAKARLAILTEERNDPKTAKKLFEEASAQCPAIFGRTCSVDQLRRIVSSINILAPPDANRASGSMMRGMSALPNGSSMTGGMGH